MGPSRFPPPCFASNITVIWLSEMAMKNGIYRFDMA